MSSEAFDHALLRLIAWFLAGAIPASAAFIYWHIPRREQRLTREIVTAIDRSIQQHNSSANAHPEATAVVKAERAAMLLAHNADPVAHPTAFDRSLGRIELAIQSMESSIRDIRSDVAETKATVGELKAGHDILTKDGTQACVEPRCPFKRGEPNPNYSGPFRRRDDIPGRG